jgi:hypothetical protein
MTTDSKRQAPPVPQDVRERLVGKTAHYPKGAPDISFKVQVTAIRMRWGHVDVFIVPVEGKGGKWVDSERVKVTE